MKKLFNHLRLFLFFSALVMLLVSCSNSVVLESPIEDTTLEEESPIEDTTLEEESPIEDAALEEPSYTLNITQQPAYTVVSYNQSATLSCKAESECQPVSYQWYKCDDMSGSNAELISGATSNSYETPVFTEKEIRYYYCVSKINSEEKLSAVTAVAYTGLPLVKIETPDSAEISSKEEWLKDATLSIEGAELDSWNISEPIMTSIRGRGNSTWVQPKKPYALKLDKKKSILGMPEHKRWVLIANYLDNSFIRNEMAFYLSEIFELDYTVHGKYVDLILNGEYKGLYWFGEAIKPDANRVNINDGSKNISDDEDKDYLIEMDVYYDEPVKFKSSIRNLPYMIKNDDYMVDDENNLTSGGESRLERLQAKINDLEILLYPDFAEEMSTNDCSAPDESFSQIIDIDSWAKFWFVNEIMDNGELGHPKSCYFTFDSENNIFKAGPVWDFDWAALFQPAYCSLKDTLYYNALFKSPEFVNLVKELWNQYYGRIHIVSKVESLRDELKFSAELDGYIWGINHNPLGMVCNDFNEHINYVRNALSTKLDVVNADITEM